MKKSFYHLVWIVLYLTLLCFFLGISLPVVFSVKYIGIFCLGTLLLCIPHLEKGMGAADRKDIVRKNAMAAGALQTFLMLLTMSGGSPQEGRTWQEIFLQEMVLHLRPMLYAYIVEIICREEKRAASVIGEESKGGPGEEELSIDSLTAQEKRIALMIRKGMTNREIAQELYIAESTVKKHVSHIFEKLEISSRRDLR